tara:strand:- start:145 stop:537 length:393 start_codon:yes stop_codon:yes gene_type:complete
MAAQVLSGTGALTYTNNTGENVRIVINFLRTGHVSTCTMSWGGGASIELVPNCTMGRNLATLDIAEATGVNISITGVNAHTGHAGGFEGAPTELGLANGDTFSITSPGSTNSGADYSVNIYNILVIPESG